MRRFRVLATLPGRGFRGGIGWLWGREGDACGRKQGLLPLPLSSRAQIMKKQAPGAGASGPINVAKT